jgi:GrpB-like predicted nucleotidyltransferase (UPF0157 family)
MTGELKETVAPDTSVPTGWTSTVVVADYDSRWPALFEEEKALILGAIGHRTISIEHIGSTSVPGLGAKPIIDIMIAVRHISDANGCLQPLQALGYRYIIKHEVEMPRRRYFRKPIRGTATHHIHMVEEESEFREHHLLFRDYLRTHTEEARRYYELKKGLARKYSSDRRSYTDAKASFIEAAIERARVAKRLIKSDDETGHRD